MAEKEVKDTAQKKAAKKGKPSFFKRLGSLFGRIGRWFKSCKAEMNKIVWTGWPTVRSNTLMVLCVIIVISALIGVLDLLFSQSIVVLGILI